MALILTPPYLPSKPTPTAGMLSGTRSRIYPILAVNFSYGIRFGAHIEPFTPVASLVGITFSIQLTAAPEQIALN